MGLCNASYSFQKLMNQLFNDWIDGFLVVYIDDLHIFSRTQEEHLEHLDTVLSSLNVEGIYDSPKKCSFMNAETEFMRMFVSSEGIRVNHEKGAVIRECPNPASLTKLRSFIGLLQLFRRFIKWFFGVSSPLTALKKCIGIGKWNKECNKYFEEHKSALISVPILVAPNWHKPFRCYVDASGSAFGGTLTQLDYNGSDLVFTYFYKKLSGTEQKYTTNERELLGLVYFLKRFRCYLEGTTF